MTKLAAAVLAALAALFAAEAAACTIPALGTMEDGSVVTRSHHPFAPGEVKIVDTYGYTAFAGCRAGLAYSYNGYNGAAYGGGIEWNGSIDNDPAREAVGAAGFTLTCVDRADCAASFTDPEGNGVGGQYNRIFFLEWSRAGQVKLCAGTYAPAGTITAISIDGGSWRDMGRAEGIACLGVAATTAQLMRMRFAKNIATLQAFPKGSGRESSLLQGRLAGVAAALAMQRFFMRLPPPPPSP